MLCAFLCVAWPVYVGFPLHCMDAQGIDDDVYMDVAGMVMSVRVGADKGLMSGKMFLTILHPQFLCFLYGQTVVVGIPVLKTDNVVVALYVLPLAVLFILHIRLQAGDYKIFLPAIHSLNLVTFTGNHPSGFILYWLHVKFVMLKGQVLFGCSVIGILRADMFYRCHRLPR